jgi:transposase-like protein
MDGQRFARVRAELARGLTADQCIEIEQLARHLLSLQLGETVAAQRANAGAPDRVCPRCGGVDVVKHGTDARGRQRFRCRKAAGCGKTFNGLSGTPLARMRKPELWLGYAQQMSELKSVSKIHASGLGISRLTAWRWRRRFLELTIAMQAKELNGIIEADETYFLQSFKGHRGWTRGTPPANRPPRYRGSGALLRGISAEQIPVLSALDRNGGIAEGIIVKRSIAEIDRVLGKRLAKHSLLCADGLPAYRSLATNTGSRLFVIKPPKMSSAQKAKGGTPRRPGLLTLGRVNSHHAVLKGELNAGLRGVSTRFLPEYLGWLRLVRRPGFAPDMFIRIASGSTPT